MCKCVQSSVRARVSNGHVTRAGNARLALGAVAVSETCRAGSNGNHSETNTWLTGHAYLEMSGFSVAPREAQLIRTAVQRF